MPTKLEAAPASQLQNLKIKEAQTLLGFEPFFICSERRRSACGADATLLLKILEAPLVMRHHHVFFDVRDAGVTAPRLQHVQKGGDLGLNR